MFFAQRWLTQVAAVGSTLGLLACSRGEAERPPPPPKPAPVAPPSTPPSVPLPPPPVGRGDLLRAVDAAGEALATGQSYPAEAAGLAGRQFTLPLPFGCHGPPPPGASLSYAWDPQQRTIRFTIRPETWTAAETIRGLVGGPETEAVEGFWVSRPWIRSAACPAQPPTTATTDGPQASPELSSGTVGVAEAFEKGGSRLMRRNGKPYQVTRKLAVGEAPPDSGYRFVLSGRIAETATPVRCRSFGADRRPLCVVEVELDRVWLETADGQRLAEWNS